MGCSVLVRQPTGSQMLTSSLSQHAHQMLTNSRQSTRSQMLTNSLSQQGARCCQTHATSQQAETGFSVMVLQRLTHSRLMSTNSRYMLTNSRHMLTYSRYMLTISHHIVTNHMLTNSRHMLTNLRRMLTDSRHMLTNSRQMLTNARKSRGGDGVQRAGAPANMEPNVDELTKSPGNQMLTNSLSQQGTQCSQTDAVCQQADMGFSVLVP